MVSAVILLIGHLILLIGLRVFFAMCSSKSVDIHQFLHSRKFKYVIALYVLFVTAAVVLPMVF